MTVMSLRSRQPFRRTPSPASSSTAISMAAFTRCSTSLTASLLTSMVPSSVVGMSARDIAGASCATVSMWSSPIVSAWQLKILGGGHTPFRGADTNVWHTTANIGSGSRKALPHPAD